MLHTCGHIFAAKPIDSSKAYRSSQQQCGFTHAVHVRCWVSRCDGRSGISSIVMRDSRLRPHTNTQMQCSTRLILLEVKFLRDSKSHGLVGDGLLILAQCYLAPPQPCQRCDFASSVADFLVDQLCLVEQPNPRVVLP